MLRNRLLSVLALGVLLSAATASTALAAPAAQHGHGRHGDRHEDRGNRRAADDPVVIVPAQAPVVVPSVQGPSIQTFLVTVPGVQTFPGVVPGVQPFPQSAPQPVIVPVPVPQQPNAAFPPLGPGGIPSLPLAGLPPLPPSALPGFPGAALPTLQQMLPPGAFQQAPLQLLPLVNSQYALSHPLLFCSADEARTCQEMADALAAIAPGFGTAILDGPDGYGVYLTYQSAS